MKVFQNCSVVVWRHPIKKVGCKGRFELSCACSWHHAYIRTHSMMIRGACGYTQGAACMPLFLKAVRPLSCLPQERSEFYSSFNRGPHHSPAVTRVFYLLTYRELFLWMSCSCPLDRSRTSSAFPCACQQTHSTTTTLSRF